MGNRVYLELRGSNLPILAEEDEEDVVSLECNNGLPLFWLALLREKDLGGYWEGEVRALYAEHDDPEDFILEPIRLAWSEASVNLTSACASAEIRLPELFPLLCAWADALTALSNRVLPRRCAFTWRRTPISTRTPTAFLVKCARPCACGTGPTTPACRTLRTP